MVSVITIFAFGILFVGVGTSSSEDLPGRDDHNVRQIEHHRLGYVGSKESEHTFFSPEK